MQEMIKTMMRLQELELIKQENKILPQENTPEHQAQQQHLDESIAELTAQVPDKWLPRYRALRKNGIAVVRELGGVCQQCRMVISVGVLIRMRKGEANCLCPNCGRFLLLSDAPTSQNE